MQKDDAKGRSVQIENELYGRSFDSDSSGSLVRPYEEPYEELPGDGLTRPVGVPPRLGVQVGGSRTEPRSSRRAMF